MRLTICTVDGGEVVIGDLEPDGVLSMVEAFSDADTEVMSFVLDDGVAQTYILRRNICRIDIEEANPR